MVTMTTVRNTTANKIMIQEGNAGVFAKKAVLLKDQKYKLELDSNATYREYVLITLPDNTPLEPVLSSDDISELREILVIRQEGTDVPQLKLIKKGDRTKHVVPCSKPVKEPIAPGPGSGPGPASPPAPVSASAQASSSAPAQPPGLFEKFKKAVLRPFGKT